MPEFTGERVVPGLVDVNLFNEHVARYEFAKRFAAGARVLDAGCGSGYGAAELAKVAREVTGIDSSAEAIAYARDHYSAANLRFEVGSCSALPGDGYDLITAFEVIEHLEDWGTFLDEARRALAPAGRLLVSTPNKVYYGESRGEAGANPFHTHEFEFAEFRDELARRFPGVTMLAQNHVESLAFAAVDPAEQDAAHFFLAVCGSAEELAPAFVWTPSTANVLRERERHIELLEGEVRQKTQWMEQQKAELAARHAEYGELLASFRAVNAELEERNRWALEWKAEAERRGARILELQEEAARDLAEFQAIAAAYEAKVTELQGENVAKTEWALETERRLGAEIANLAGELRRAVELLDARDKTIEERTLWAQSLERELAEWRRRFEALRAEWWVRVGAGMKVVADRR